MYEFDLPAPKVGQPGLNGLLKELSDHGIRRVVPLGRAA